MHQLYYLIRIQQLGNTEQGAVNLPDNCALVKVLNFQASMHDCVDPSA
jgi:hypothetical protein